MLAALLTVFVISSVVYYIFKYHTKWKYIEQFPGPTTLPFIGNAHQLGLNPTDYLKNLFLWWRKYNCGTYRVWIGPQPYVVITDPKDVEAVLSSQTLLQKGDIYDLFDDWLGKGLLTSHGQKWHKHRKMITPAFHFKILVEFLDAINKNSNKFVEYLAEKSKDSKIFDFQEMVHYCTLDTICETAMGTEINSMDNHDSELVLAFQDMCFVIQNRAFSAWKRNPFLYTFSKEYHAEIKALKILKSFTLGVIEKRANIIKKNLEQANSVTSDENIKKKQVFLDTLLTAQIDGRPLTTYEVYEEVSTFMFEGHDTTTSGVTFCTYLLSRHPEIQAKVFAEQKSIFNGNLSLSPTYQDVQDMKYLELVIKESQRLYPSVPVIGRCNQQDFMLNGKLIPANTTLTIFIIAMGYNATYFADPLKFNPDRFLDREGTNPFEYVPFSAGPRNCIGQKFAMMEMKSIISNIVRNFEILPPNEGCLANGDYEKLGTNTYDPILASVLTLKSDNGVQLRLRKRS